MALAAGDRDTESSEYDVARDANQSRNPTPVAALVDERLTYVEEDGLQPRGDEVEVGLGRHLHEPRVSLDDRHPAARRLHQRGAVCCRSRIGGVSTTQDRGEKACEV